VSRILVIDDEPNLRKVIHANLSASGYDVNMVENGEEGIKLAKSLKPDLVLLDIKMPGISGWDLLSTIRTDPGLKNVPVIIMTAFMRENEEAKAREMRASFIEKPFGVSELLEQVKKALGEQ